MTRDEIGYYLDRVGFPLRRRELMIFDKLLHPSIAIEDPQYQGFSVYRIGAGDLNRLQYPDPCGWLERHEAFEWLAHRQCMMMAAVREREMIGYCWVESREADVSFFDMTVPLAADSVYVSKVAVIKGVRGSGIGKALVATALAESIRAGFRRATIACVPANAAMRGVLHAQQWSYFQSVKYLRGGWARLYRVTTLRESGGPPISAVFFTAAGAAKSILARNMTN
jgi:GNAT superfamily N-acetyltransferase